MRIDIEFRDARIVPVELSFDTDYQFSFASDYEQFANYKASMKVSA